MSERRVVGDAPGTKSELLPVHSCLPGRPGLAWQPPLQALAISVLRLLEQITPNSDRRRSYPCSGGRKTKLTITGLKPRCGVSVSVGGVEGARSLGRILRLPAPGGCAAPIPVCAGKAAPQLCVRQLALCLPLMRTPGMPSRVHLALSSLDPSLKSHLQSLFVLKR